MSRHKTKYKKHLTYLPYEYHRTFKGDGPHGLNGNHIKLRAYKGEILLYVGDGSPAWLFGEDFDELITLLRKAKRMWLVGHRQLDRVVACTACRAGSGSLCKKHRGVVEALTKKGKVR